MTTIIKSWNASITDTNHVPPSDISPVTTSLALPLQYAEMVETGKVRTREITIDYDPQEPYREYIEAEHKRLAMERQEQEAQRQQQEQQRLAVERAAEAKATAEAEKERREQERIQQEESETGFSDYKYSILSAKRDKLKQQIAEWLENAGVPHDKLYTTDGGINTKNLNKYRKTYPVPSELRAGKSCGTLQRYCPSD